MTSRHLSSYRTLLFGRKCDHASSNNFESPLSEEVNRLGVCDALLLEDPCGERLGCVVVEDGDGALDDDGAVVVDVVGEVDGASADLAAGSENGLVDMMPPHTFSAETRQ